MGRNPQPFLQVVGGFICLAVGKPLTSLPLAWPVANFRISRSACPAACFSLRDWFLCSSFALLWWFGSNIYKKKQALTQSAHLVERFITGMIPMQQQGFPMVPVMQSNMPGMMGMNYGSQMPPGPMAMQVCADEMWLEMRHCFCFGSTSLLLRWDVVQYFMSPLWAGTCCGGDQFAEFFVSLSLRCWSRAACKCKWCFVNFLLKNLVAGRKQFQRNVLHCLAWAVFPFVLLPL